uniref:30 kDa spicule matrix protein alpha n=1 Tax=Strongylocentrotus purpuratus TaxID=7668 RepID=SM30A_STRPU|nr:RecName: Full=30 kDa spicule matrix protein alpha; AltName: Full=SM30-alpha; Flags: Precursor [Strongylocentrotus purpuratus]AAB60620.1 SM30-alpha protein [Strongylocentrotus purpuratus]
MRGFVYVLVCVLALASFSRAQLPGGGGPVLPGGGPTIGPVNPDPTRTEVCAKFWVQEGNSCYLFDSGAFLRQVAASRPVVVNNENGLFQAAANMYCGQMHPNASLVTVNSLAENNFLYEWAVRMMVEPEPVWIGLHAGPMGQWQWYSGEPVTYTNWERMTAPMAEPGLGAMIFDADIIAQMFNNQVEITPQWVPEQAINDRHALICEYHPSGMTAAAAAATNAPTFPPMATAPPMAATTRGPVMFQNNPRNLVNSLTGGRFGGSLLHEIPRRQRMRPSNYRKNPYFGIQP